MFDALKFLSRLVETDVRQAMQDLRGEPEELFRHTPQGNQSHMKFAIEALLPTRGVDDFGATFETPAQRIRYELHLQIKEAVQGVFVAHEDCRIIKAEVVKIAFQPKDKQSRSSRKKPFLETERDSNGNPRVFRIRQDGLAKSGTARRGNPLQLPAAEVSRTALSTIATSEFRHLYALKS